MKLPQVLLSEGVSWRTWLEVEGGRNCPLEGDEVAVAEWRGDLQVDSPVGLKA